MLSSRSQEGHFFPKRKRKEGQGESHTDHFVFLGIKTRHPWPAGMAVPVAVAPTSWPVCTAGAVRTRRIIMRGTGGSTVASWRRAAGGGRRAPLVLPAPCARTPGAGESHRLRRDASRASHPASACHSPRQVWRCTLHSSSRSVLCQLILPLWILFMNYDCQCGRLVC